MSDSLRPHGLQRARLPCPSPSSGVCSHSCPLSLWCHPEDRMNPQAAETQSYVRVCVMDSNHRERGWSLGGYAWVTTASIVLLFGYQTAIPLMPCPGVYSLWATWEGARGELKICPEFAIIWSSLFRPQLTQFLDNLWWRKRTDQEWKEMDKSRQALGVCSLRLWVGSVEP